MKPTANHQLGQLLLGMGAIDRRRLDEALAEQRATGRPLGQILLSNQWIERSSLLKVLKEQTGLPAVDLTLTPPDPAIMRLLDSWMAWQYGVLPLRVLAGHPPMLVLAVHEPLPNRIIKIIEEETAHRVRVLACDEFELRRALARFYPRGTDPHADTGAIELPEENPDAPPAVVIANGEERILPVSRPAEPRR